MKQTLLILALFLQSFLAFAENITEKSSVADSLLIELRALPHDTTRLKLLEKLVLTEQNSPHYIEYAEEMLRQIGYFPLMGGYKHLFRISNTKKYKAGTSFEEIVSLYKFDAELRELFFKYLLQIERQMRSLMSYYFTEMYGTVSICSH